MKALNFTSGILNDFENHYGQVELYAYGSNEVYELLKNEASPEMLENDEFWCAKFDFENKTYAIMGAGELTSSGEYLLAELSENIVEGIIFTSSEIENLNEEGYLTDLQLLDDNGGEPYGNCIIVAASSFTKDEIDLLGLADMIMDVYYTQNFSDEKAELEYEGPWYAKGCTGEAFFTEESDFILATDRGY